MWSFYRSALALRRADAAFRTTGLEWLDSPEHSLVFRRDGLHCAVNTGPTDVEVVLPGEPRLWAGVVAQSGAGTVLLAPDSAVWSVLQR
jgi:alpha-glucosidase